MICTNFLPLSVRAADLLIEAFASIDHPTAVTGTNAVVSPALEQSEGPVHLRSGVCGRCGCRFSWRDKYGRRFLRYCDACLR